ncbi:hypothetical protein [Aeromonas veronii]|uniref:hypothetical protein n=1 Tax=Aeromonas veronii TaxID=654 RepID=UPI0024436FFB|nr:hypothetical protein [Aeromonas veronii]
MLNERLTTEKWLEELEQAKQNVATMFTGVDFMSARDLADIMEIPLKKVETAIERLGGANRVDCFAEAVITHYEQDQIVSTENSYFIFPPWFYVSIGRAVIPQGGHIQGSYLEDLEGVGERVLI